MGLTLLNAGLVLPSGVILIHAGDSEVVTFNDWLATLPHKVIRRTLTTYFLFHLFQQKVVIAGNHEMSFDPDTLEEARDYMRQVGEEGDTHKVVNNISMLN